MSDEQRRDEEEVEAHRLRRSANEEPSDEAEADDEVEAHVRRAVMRKDVMRKD
jgi:hypothetical protein